jgi:hypothetical protein
LFLHTKNFISPTIIIILMIIISSVLHTLSPSVSSSSVCSPSISSHVSPLQMLFAPEFFSKFDNLM